MNGSFSFGQFQKVNPKKPTANGQSLTQRQSLKPATCPHAGQATSSAPPASHALIASRNGFHCAQSWAVAASSSSTTCPQCGQTTGPTSPCKGANTFRLALTPTPLARSSSSHSLGLSTAAV